jgi:catechol 2,3-dioxygenase-like lactoylglutathione lyase family enzyme
LTSPERPSFAALVPELVCTDIERSVRFYTDVLGFEVLYSRADERFAYLRREGAEIMLEQPTGRSFVIAPLEYPFGRGIVPQIWVSDIQSLYAAVVSAGAELHLPLEEKWYRMGELVGGNHQFVVIDPDGYLMRFAEDLGTRPVESHSLDS